MRELKFRVWFIKGETMSNVLGFKTEPSSDILPDLIDLYLPDNITATNYVDEIELIQYTGLLDKNGVEIYEGDIVKYKICSYGGFDNVTIDVTGFIEYKIGCYCVTTIKARPKGRLFNEASGYDFARTPFEIIGNIHENPELLERK